MRKAAHRGICAIALLAAAVASAASRSQQSMAHLAREADLVAVVEVTAAWNDPSELRLATAIVREVWKGVPRQQIQLIAGTYDPCDMSSAVVGEVLLVFLAQRGANPGMSILAKGHGRFELTENDGQMIAFTKGYERWTGLPTVRAKDSAGNEATAVPLQALHAEVKRWLETENKP
jgi:hypothetical protein